LEYSYITKGVLHDISRAVTSAVASLIITAQRSCGPFLDRITYATLVSRVNVAIMWPEVIVVSQH